MKHPQTGKNFVYPSELLEGVSVTVKADKEPLDRVLNRMFAGTDIVYKMRGRNVMLMRKAVHSSPTPAKVTISGFVREKGSGEVLAGAVVRNREGGGAAVTNANGFYSLTVDAGLTGLTASCTGYQTVIDQPTDITSDKMTDFYLVPAYAMAELTVTESRNRVMMHESAEVGSMNLTRTTIRSTPVVMGESDVIKTMQLQPGVSAGIEGFAGMYVHGGNTDENMYMIDNIPLYQVNHMFGLFSAFNTEAMRNVDFYKSSFPAKYDGRLSSFMDVHTRDGSMESHHGSFTLGPMALVLDVNGPIRKGRTTYSVAVRRTWSDLLAMPFLAIGNSSSDDDEEISAGSSFIDANLKVNHKFSERSSGHVMVYYGDDYMKGGSELNIRSEINGGDCMIENHYYDKDITSMRWGNLVASAGWKYVLNPRLYAEFTTAYTRYFSRMKTDWDIEERYDGVLKESTRDIVRSKNNITDWMARADMEWRPGEGHKVEFGGSYTHHSFLPSHTTRRVITQDFNSIATDSAYRYYANELNAYAGDDWTVNNKVRINAGVHLSLFGIDRHVHGGVSPRVAVRYTPGNEWTLKASYSRAHQYVHQLSQSFISLPTDQWVPITGNFKPQRSDKVAVGVYRPMGIRYSLAVEGYMK
ncbi:MAG: TonB-dependent receptor, partial [Muribaculaceae bacterium]|nr:TonB-dependent receptor [Muribaculaceae bacterium]